MAQTTTTNRFALIDKIDSTRSRFTLALETVDNVTVAKFCLTASISVPLIGIGATLYGYFTRDFSRTFIGSLITAGGGAFSAWGVSDSLSTLRSLRQACKREHPSYPYKSK